MSALRLEVVEYRPPIIKDVGRLRLWETVQVRAKKLFLPFNMDVWFAPRPAINRTTGYVAQYRGSGIVLVGLNWKRIPQEAMEKLEQEEMHIYRLDLQEQTCNCPCFMGSKGKPGNGFCKHLLGQLEWMTTPYEITPKGYFKW